MFFYWFGNGFIFVNCVGNFGEYFFKYCIIRGFLSDCEFFDDGYIVCDKSIECLCCLSEVVFFSKFFKDG